jgi:hypothetical protein
MWTLLVFVHVMTPYGASDPAASSLEIRGFSSEQNCLSQGPKAVKTAVRANPGAARISATFTCLEVR